MPNNSLDFKIFHSVSEVDPVSWDQLSAGRSFTSHQWYRYGETVMADSLPTYIVIYDQDQPIARATFSRIINEPISVQSKFIKRMIEMMLERWPLFICRSPISGMSGLILPSTSVRNAAQAIISMKAKEFLKQTGCSFLIFDYLTKDECIGWPANFVPLQISGPGTVMRLTTPDFDAYLSSGNKKDRQHYKKTLREAEKLNIQIKRHRQVNDLDEAIALIRGVERRFGSPENPWAYAMLSHFGMIPGATFLTAMIDNQLVGCGLILEDNGAQINAILGLAENVSYVYFMLVYESLKIAFEHNIQLIHLGSGAYELKKQLGFSLEDNNHSVFFTPNPFLQALSHLGR